MSDISEKTKIPIGWAATILSLIAGLVFQAGVSYTRFSALEVEYEKHRSAEDAIHSVSQSKGFETELRVQKLEILLGSIDNKLESISKKLDRLDRGGK